MKVYDRNNNGHRQFICDICGCSIEKWHVNQLLLREYAPGEKHDTVSSDIKTYQKKLVDLCPGCMQKVLDQFGVKFEE